jgi:hypothetical protein
MTSAHPFGATTALVWRGEAAAPEAAPNLTIAEAARLVNSDRALLRFRIDRELGRGGSAQVFLAYDSEIRRTVAVRFAQVAAGGAPQIELAVLGQLDHPNILPVYDLGYGDQGLLWTVMRYAPYPSLRQLLAERPHELGGLVQRVQVVLTVASALAHAHERGICHHDVSPGNILVDGHGRVALVDWAEATTAAMRAQGLRPRRATRGYMAPEVASDQPVGPAADIYSLGAVLHHLVHGHPPGVPPSPTIAVPRALQAIIERCLAAEPGQRYASMPALLTDLQAWLAGQPVQALPEAWPWRLWRVARKRWGWLAVAIAAASLLVTGLVIERQAAAVRRAWVPVLREDFTAPLDPARWAIEHRHQRLAMLAIAETPGSEDCTWVAGGGALHSRLAPAWRGSTQVVLRQRLPADLRATWTMRPLGNANNLGIVLGEDPETDLAIELGSQGDAGRVIVRGGAEMPVLAARQAAPACTAGVDHAMALELVGRNLTLTMDGIELIRADGLPFLLCARSRRIGFFIARNQVTLRDLVVSRLELPQQMRVQDVIEDLLAAGEHQAAWRQCEQLLQQPERWGAGIHLYAGIALHHLGRPEADAQLELAGRSPDDEVAWQALSLRLLRAAEPSDTLPKAAVSVYLARHPPWSSRWTTWQSLGSQLAQRYRLVDDGTRETDVVWNDVAACLDQLDRWRQALDIDAGAPVPIPEQPIPCIAASRFLLRGRYLDPQGLPALAAWNPPPGTQAPAASGRVVWPAPLGDDTFAGPVQGPTQDVLVRWYRLGQQMADALEADDAAAAAAAFAASEALRHPIFGTTIDRMRLTAMWWCGHGDRGRARSAVQDIIATLQALPRDGMQRWGIDQHIAKGLAFLGEGNTKLLTTPGDRAVALDLAGDPAAWAAYRAITDQELPGSLIRWRLRQSDAR